MAISRLLLSRLRCACWHQYNNLAPRYSKKFTEYRFYATTVKLKIDSQNIVSSGLPDIKNFENVYLHNLIWDKYVRWSDKIALVCSVTGRSYTYDQLRKTCSRLATSFRKNNLLPGDIIAIVLQNIPEFAIILLAANEAGLNVALINPAYTEYEMKRQFENLDIKAVFTFAAKYSTVQAVIEENLIRLQLPIIIVDDDTGTSVIPGTTKFDDLVREDIKEFSFNYGTGVEYDDTAFLVYSSGTTGLPKKVEITHRSMVANILQCSQENISPGIQTCAFHQEIVPLILPLYHCYALTVILYTYLRLGAKLVCLPKFSPEAFIKILKDHRPTILYVVPPMIQMMISNSQLISPHMETVRMIMSGAAPMGNETVEMFKSRISNTVSLVQGYGMSETSPVVSLSATASPDSSGYLVPNTQLRIVGHDDDNPDKNLGIREVGEIYIRGPQLMKGYYKNPEATADTIKEGWLKTGDLGYYTEDGLLYVTGRLKELIKVQGHQVAPTELEEIIRNYDKVQDAAVIGVKHDQYGEVPKAFVVVKPNMNISEDEVKAFVAKHVTKHKQLGYVQIVESIPKSPTGKILRRILQQM